MPRSSWVATINTANLTAKLMKQADSRKKKDLSNEP
jgi:hypothetical protein